MDNKTQSLDTVSQGETVQVVSLQGGKTARQRLNQMGIHAGDTLFVSRSSVMAGPLLIRVHGMEVALGKGIAHKVEVSKSA